MHSAAGRSGYAWGCIRASRCSARRDTWGSTCTAAPGSPAGHGGQVVLSQTTRDLLDSAFEVVDLGLHRLKDYSEPQRLYQLGTEQFPPLKTLHQTNLPVPATPFLGRERELGDVLALLGSSRVLTLTGRGDLPASAAWQRSGRRRAHKRRRDSKQTRKLATVCEPAFATVWPTARGCRSRTH